MRLPTDSEIHAGAERLGLLENGQVPPAKRAQIARAVQMADAETAATTTQHASDAAFAYRIREMQSAFEKAGVGHDNTAAVLGAIAAPLWREMKENDPQ